MSVKVEARQTEHSGSNNGLIYWKLVFTISTNIARFEFIVHEPYNFSFREWSDLAANKNTELHQSNNDVIKHVDDSFIFKSCSGAVGTSAIFTIYGPEVTEPLSVALVTAYSRGYHFRA